MIGSAPAVIGGPFPADEVSRRLQAIDVALSAFSDGVSTRRGSFMAGLRHGIATVATSGPATDGLLRQADGAAFLLAAADDPGAFSSAVMGLVTDSQRRQELAVAGGEFYERHFAWERIAGKLIGTLWPAGSPRSSAESLELPA